VGFEDSSFLSYHLNALKPLVIQREGKNKLSELGSATYNLICKIATYSESTSILSSLRKELPFVIIANAILWAAAILAIVMFEGSLHQITIQSFAVLWFTSNIILYSISKRVRK
jgi:ABC-type multidrug transport system permease subunit